MVSINKSETENLKLGFLCDGRTFGIILVVNQQKENNCIFIKFSSNG